MTSAAGAPPISCSGSVGSSCGPRPVPVRRHRPSPQAGPRRGDLERLGRGWAAATTPTPKRSPRAWPHCPQPPGHRLAARRGRVDQRGAPTLTWHFDQTALEREQATDGWYGLLTNLDPAHADAAGVLARYQGQEVVERRYGAFKGPLAVAPMFVQSNRRIQALSP
jgi:hypothetical protein